MKKVLSIILAAALLISLIPTAFAVVDEETLTLQYVFNDTVTDSGDVPTLFNKEIKTTTGSYKLLAYSIFNSTAINSTYIKVVADSSGTASLLFEIDITEPGIYKPELSFTKAARGGYLYTYVFDKAVADEIGLPPEDGKKSTVLNEKLSALTALGNLHINTQADAVETSPYEFDNVLEFKTTGKYYLAFMVKSGDEAALKACLDKGERYENMVMFHINEFSLTKTGEIEVEEPENPVNEAIVYGFDADSTGNGSTGNGVSITSGDYTKSISGGYWEYVTFDTFKSPSIYGTYVKCTVKDDIVASPQNPAYLTLKIKVDKPGTYTPSVNCQYKKRGGQLKVYLTNTKSFPTVYTSELPLDNKFIQTYSDADGAFEDHFFQNVTLNEGTYYLHFVVDGVDEEVTKAGLSAQEHIKNFTLTPVEGGLDGSVTFFADANVSGADIDVNIAYSQGDVGSVARGKYVKVTANPLEGYIFRGWVRGSADNGIWVSSEEEYGFTAMTHTMLTAVYEAVAEGNVVEYYNENGTYLETKAAEEAAPSAPALVGYEFDNWYVNNDTLLSQAVLGELTRAVAKHTVKADTFDVEVESGIEIAVDGVYTYDKEVTLTAGKEVYWLRDGKVVDYGTSYTFNVWGDTSITTSETGNDLPKVILDEVVKGEARMIEYDNAGYEIVEVGIIFGNGASVEIGSCEEKMVSQRNLSHGQFTASSDYSAARGYIIYKNINGGLEIIYAD